MLKEFVVSDVFENAQHRKYHPPETLVPDDDGYPYICASNQDNTLKRVSDENKVALGEFELGGDTGLFDIYSPSKRFNANIVQFGGKYPYVARGSSNNGIRGYITEDERYLSPAKSLSFGQDTATVFYQPNAYFTGDKIKVMVLNNHELTPELAEYFIAVISKAFSTFAWGQSSFNENIIKQMKIMLPITSTGEPDFDYMEKYIRGLEQERIRELEQERVRELEAYLKAAGLNDYELTQEDKAILTLHKKREVRDKTFKIEDLFDVSIAKAIDKRKVIFSNDGKHDFVGRSTENYGVQGKLFELSYKPNDAKTFSLVQVGTSACLYRERSWYASQNIFLLKPKDDRICDTHMYFEATINAYLRSKYSSAYIYPKMSDVKDMQILLPASPSGQPDFAFMEKYITAMEKQTIAGVVRYKDKIIEETKKVVSSAVAS